MNKIKIILLFFLLAFGLSACTTSEQADIYTSIYPIEFMTKEIVKEHLKVDTCYPRGADVHDYEPPANTIVRMTRSKLVFYVGAGLEAFIENAEDSTFKDSNTTLVELSESVVLLDYDGEEYLPDDHSTHPHSVDPHIWLDPSRMIIMANVILTNLIAVAPEHEQEFRVNHAALTEKLQQLDSDYITAFRNPEIAKKIILVDHDAYLYWQNRYGIERIRARIDNHSCDVIPSVFIENLQKIRDNNIEYIAVTTNEGICAVVNQYISEANLTQVTLHNIATITSKEEADNKDYFELMYINLSTLITIFPKVISE